MIAILLMVIILSATMTSAQAATQKGVGLLLYDNQPSFPSKSEALLNHLQELGANSIQLNVPIFQDGKTATQVYRNQRTPTDKNLGKMIHQAHERGFSVMMRPLMDQENLIKDQTWRGGIEPTDPKAWFESYTSVILHYATLSQQTGVEHLCIGAELSSMEKYSEEWEALIKQVKSVYTGTLIYSFNWDQFLLTKPPFASKLTDAKGERHPALDAYFEFSRTPLGITDPDRLVPYWKEWLRRVREVTGVKDIHNVIFTEVGVTPYKDAYRTPWGAPASRIPDENMQPMYITAMCRAAGAEIGGFYFWEFQLNKGGDPFNLYGVTKAEQAIKACFASMP